MPSLDDPEENLLDSSQSGQQTQSNLKRGSKKKGKSISTKSRLDFNLPAEQEEDKSQIEPKTDSKFSLSARKASKRLSRKFTVTSSRKSNVSDSLSRSRISSKARASSSRRRKSTASSLSSSHSSAGSSLNKARKTEVREIQSRLMSAVESKLFETRNPFADEDLEETEFHTSDLSKLSKHSSSTDSTALKSGGTTKQPSSTSKTFQGKGQLQPRKSFIESKEESKSHEQWLLPAFDDDDDDQNYVGETEELLPVTNDDAFIALQKVYDDIQVSLNKETNQEINLSPVQDHFSNLWEGIHSSHSNELRLIHIDRALSTALSATLAKSRFILKLAEDDPEYAQKLAVKLENAWVLVDAGDEEERSNKNKIDLLKQEIFELNRNINRASAMRGQDTLKELGAIKSELEKQRDAMTTEANKFRSSLNVLYAKRQELFEKKTNLSEKERLFDEEYAAQQEAIARELTRKERITSDTDEILQKIRNKERDTAELQRNLSYTTNKISDSDKALRDQRTANESALRDAEFGNTRIEKLRLDCEAQSRVVERLTLASYRQAQELKDRESDVNVLRHESHRATRQRSLQTKKIIALRQALSTLDMERENLKAKISFLEQELEVAQKRLEQHKKKVEGLIKEKTFVNRNLHRATAVTSEHANQAANHEAAVDSLEKQVHVYNLEIESQRALIARLENERDFYSNEAIKLAHQVDFRLNEMKKQDLMILKYKRKLGEIETQVKKSQQVCDAADNDKKIFERFLRDTLADILENNVKLRRLNNQVSSLKYQLNAKDEIIHLEALRYDRTLKETEFFSKQAARIQRMVEDMQCQNQALEAERSTLGCAIAEIQGEFSKQNYYVNSAESRSLIHYRKLMDRDVELHQVWNTWRKQHSTIRIGASHYKNLMKEIITLRYEILLNRRSNAIRSRNTGQIDKYRHEEAVLSSCIYKEKCMIGGLETQLQHPINVHRWRILEATNPEAYEMILKINLLTKRVVERTCEVKNLGKQLLQQEDMYVEVRKSMENCPGLELPEEVTYFQHLLNAKRTQYALLQGELQVAEAEHSYYRSHIVELNKKLAATQNAIFHPPSLPADLDISNNAIMSGSTSNQNGNLSPKGLPKNYFANSNNLIRSHAIQPSNYPQWLTSSLRPNLGIARLSNYRPLSALLSRSAFVSSRVSATSPPIPTFKSTPRVPSHIVPTRNLNSTRTYRIDNGSATPPPTPVPPPTPPPLSLAPALPTMNLTKPLSVSTPNPAPTVTPPKQRQKPSESSAVTTASTSLAALPPRINSFSQRSLSNLKAFPTTERNRALRLHLERAIKEHKIFSIMGVFPAIRRSLVRRGWMEKNLAISAVRSLTEYRIFLSGLESGNKTYDEESEQAWISRVLRDYPSDFIWTHRRDAISWNTLQPSQMVNRHPRAVFTSKVGIAACLQNLHWFAESNISATFFPRCYRLCVEEEKTAFVNDFRLCACMSLLKWVVGAYEKSGESGLMDTQSLIPATITDFAIKKMQAYNRLRRHEDLDTAKTPNTNSSNVNITWESFLKQYYLIVMEGHRLGPEDPQDTAAARYDDAKKALKKISPYWPQFGIDGINNVWICKPGARSRGNGIVLMNQLDRILGLLQHSNFRESNWVAQKYIERPLLIYKTKFDIRQWFTVTDWNPLTVWCYKESYIRFCSKPFSLTDFHESIHLCNNAVQARYQNSEARDSALPTENMWDNYTFQAYLRYIGKPTVWDKIIYPGMKQGILGVLLASQENADFRKNSFELYGADFMLSEDFTPWMIEVNASPCMSSTTSVTARMCGQCLEDLMKVVVDRRDNRQADTGLFELIYKQQQSSMPHSLYNGNAASGLEYAILGQKVGQDIDWLSKVSKSRSRQSVNSTVNMTSLSKGKSSSSIPIAATFAELMNRIKLSDINGFAAFEAHGSSSTTPAQSLSRNLLHPSKKQLSKSKSPEDSSSFGKSEELQSSSTQPGTTSSPPTDLSEESSNVELAVIRDNFVAEIKESAESLVETDHGAKLNLVKFSLPQSAARRGKKKKKPLSKSKKSRDSLTSSRNHSSQSIKSQESAQAVLGNQGAPSSTISSILSASSSKTESLVASTVPSEKLVRQLEPHHRQPERASKTGNLI